eukprot:symbB.v1.2.029492.t1/scaffold3227.1/size60689/4
MCFFLPSHLGIVENRYLPTTTVGMVHATSGTLPEPFYVVEIVVLDIAELELQLEVDVVIRIAPSLTATRYLLAKKETMTTVSPSS